MKELTITYLQEDPTYRLSTANGSGTWNGTNLSYGTSMVYSPSGRIEQKDMESQRLSNQQSQYGVNYHNGYSYGYNNNPYALKRIQDPNTGEIDDFEWDIKGNMTRHYGKRKQYLCWTEDNRLEAFMDDKENAAYYSYDASGERNLKLTGGVVQTTQNGVPFYSPFLEDPTLYASGLITINKKGYTKHYFEESKRICSKIGGGFSNATCDITKSIKPITPYTEHGDILKNGLYSTFYNCIGKSVKIDDAAYKIYNAMAHERTRNDAELTFYYNSDHLGSSSYITNSSGIITQTLAYLPYGEEWIDIDNTPPYLTPYKFSGKEKDEETSYNYYGARYYTDYLSIWLSVDPMSDKYPHQTNYVYCSNSPVMVIDPDGMDEWEVTNKGYVAWKNNNGGKDNNTLFALDGKNKRTGKSQMINGNILSQLSEPKNDVSKAEGKNGNEMLKAFKFLADNTNVEWRTDKKKDGSYALGTKHDRDWSPSSNQMGGYGDNDVVSSIHSHPYNWGSRTAEMESMGWKSNSPDAFGGSDWSNQIKDYNNNNNKEKYKSQVYFKHSQSLYRITPYKISNPRKVTKSSPITY